MEPVCDESSLGTFVLLLLTIGIIFVKRNHLEEKYGLDRWPKDPGKYWYFPGSFPPGISGMASGSAAPA